MTLDWQYAAVIACVGWAIATVVRRAANLFGKSSTTGCGTTACGACPSKTSPTSANSTEGFVSLETLVASSHSRGNEKN